MTYDSRPDTYDHIQKVRLNLTEVIQELLDRAMEHDRSKLVEPEVEVFDRVTPLLKDTVYGSDEYKGYLRDMGPALEHHYQNNSHHPEHYKEGIAGMDLLDVVEMLCDWVAASKRTKDGDIHKSMSYNVERFSIEPQLAKILTNTLERMAW